MVKWSVLPLPFFYLSFSRSMCSWIFSLNGFFQNNYIINSDNNSHIDLIFSNFISIDVNHALESAVSPKAFYPTLSLSFQHYLSPPLPFILTSLDDFSKEDYHTVTKFLNSLNWVKNLNSLDANTATSTFFDALNTCPFSYFMCLKFLFVL